MLPENTKNDGATGQASGEAGDTSEIQQEVTGPSESTTLSETERAALALASIEANANARLQERIEHFEKKTNLALEQLETQSQKLGEAELWMQAASAEIQNQSVKIQELQDLLSSALRALETQEQNPPPEPQNQKGADENREQEIQQSQVRKVRLL